MKHLQHSLRFLLIILSLSTGINAYAQAPEFTTFILVRHAEKVDDSEDPALSEMGKQRAQALARHLEETELAAIYSTEFIRTKKTVEPTARQKGLEISIYEPFDSDLLTRIQADNKGKTVLVTGHSNTIPPIVNLLVGEKRFELLDDTDYDDIFVVTVTEVGNGSVLHLNY